MNIGTTIKRLRRSKDMTQESLAEYLGVSVSAVSQWESGKTAPDLSLIPPICNLFGVTSDELLGIDLCAKQKKIREIMDRADARRCRGYQAEAHELLLGGLRQFPDCFEMMSALIHNDYHLMHETAYSREERDQFRDEAVRYAELILEKCTEDTYRHSAIQILCYIYPTVGRFDRADELARTMPTMSVCSDFLAAAIHQGDRGYQYEKMLMFNLIQHLSNHIVAYGRKRDNGEFYYTDEDRSALRDKQIAFLNLMFEKGDMGFFHCHLAAAHAAQAKYYAKRKDEEKTLFHLDRAAEHAIGFVAFASGEKFTHSSLLFLAYEDGGGFTTGSSRNDAMELLQKMASSDFDFIREKEAFVHIAGRLKTHAGNWTLKK